MKALVYTANQEMTYREEAEPRPEPGECAAPKVVLLTGQ
jgi:hypothetical protein